MTALQFEASAIERWPLERLLSYATNARQHSPDQIARIAASIVQFGFVTPCLIDGRGVLIAGHGRLLAARQLGLAEVPVIRVEHLSDADVRALRLADNRLGELSTWNAELLAAELARLQEDGFNLDLVGFSDDDLDRMLADAVEDGPDPGRDDEAPEPPPEPVTKPGDLWILGDHRLVCGDATTIEALDRVLAGETAAMCFTDSPYNVDYKGGAGTKRKKIANDALGAGFGTFLYDACVLILSVTDGAVYMCMSSSELHTLYRAFTEAGGHWSTFVIWAKNSFTLGRSDYQRQYEPILYGWREGAEHHWCGDRDQGDVWMVDRPRVNDLHPTMKPVELVERAVRNSSRRGDIVLDPFAGSGTTLIACERTGRRARLVELDPAYCDVIVRRYQEHTSKAATLDGDGRTFDALATGRHAAMPECSAS